VAIARALIANPDLLRQFESGRDVPANPCTHCNRCAARTATSPLGCYDPSRFESQEAMQAQILAWNHAD
jgi:2,4-dienoyl-CoA reductase (NADPH2)